MKQKTIIIIVAVVIVSVVLFFVFRKKQNRSSQPTAPGSDTPAPPTCNDPNEWKSRAAIHKGLYIPTTFFRRWPNQINECRLLGWMYHIKYETEWGADKDMNELAGDAEWHAAKQLGITT
jgi:hypothetical protein